MKNINVIIVLVLYLLIVTGCVTPKASGPINNIEVNQKENFNNIDSTKKSTIHNELELTISKIIKEYIPYPFNPIIHEDSLEYKGKWKGDVMSELNQKMKEVEWELYDGMGVKKFYRKTIKGKEIKISILPMENGGPTEEEATTIITIKLLP